MWRAYIEYQGAVHKSRNGSADLTKVRSSHPEVYNLTHNSQNMILTSSRRMTFMISILLVQCSRPGSVSFRMSYFPRLLKTVSPESVKDQRPSPKCSLTSSQIFRPLTTTCFLQLHAISHSSSRTPKRTRWTIATSVSAFSHA